MKRANITRLREMHAKATPGPWEVRRYDACGEACWEVINDEARRAFDDGSADGEYARTCYDGTRDAIVAAMNALPALLREVELLREVAKAADDAVACAWDDSIGEALDKYTAEFGEEDGDG